MKKFKIPILVSSLAFFMACGPAQKKAEEAADEVEEVQEVVEEAVQEVVPSATATINSASGSTLQGTAVFTTLADGKVQFTLNVNRATPGEHAVHLHQKGDCSSPDGKSAGGHWNPLEVEHGSRKDSTAFHAGDIDNLVVGEDGTGTIEMTVEGLSVGGDDSSNVVGRAVIIHAKADDFTSQPSGAAGPRQGCGVVEMN